MAKGGSRDHLAVSLFPFLSILACVIGVLTLMITALALGQIGEKAADQAQVDQAEEYLRLRKEADELKPRLEGVREALVKGKATENELRRQEKRREELEAQMKQLKAPPQTSQALEAKAKELAQRNEKMRQELAALLASLAPLREEAGKLPDPKEAGRITVRPGGSGTNLKPVFVECGERGIIIHEKTALAVPRAGMETNAALLKVLDRVAEQEDATIIFLVRPSGIATYNQARNLARSRYARNGKLPVPGEGPLDLSLFRVK